MQDQHRDPGRQECSDDALPWSRTRRERRGDRRCRRHQRDVTLDELLAQFPDGSLDAASMQRAAALGLVELLPDGRVRVADERFVTTGAALARLGVPAPAILDEWEHLADTMAGVATRFVAVFEEHLLPHDWRDALTGDEAEHLAAALGELRRQAETVVVAALDRAIADLARERLGELLDGDA